MLFTLGPSTNCSSETEPVKFSSNREAIPHPSLSPSPFYLAQADSSHWQEGQVDWTLSLAAAPADNQTTGYLIWIYSLCATFMSQSRCAWDFIDKPKEYQNLILLVSSE